jgi:hypothetical protein
MFGVFLLEREYPKFHEVWPSLVEWNQTYGLVAFIILLSWFLIASIRYLRGRTQSLRFGITWQLANLDAGQGWRLRIFRFLGVLTLLAWVGTLVTSLVFASLPAPTPTPAVPLSPGQAPPTPASSGFASTLYQIACGLALLTLAWEPLVSLTHLSWRRLWGLARFSMKEAIRRRVLWGFLLLMLVFLFASWFVPAGRAVWPTYVKLVFFIMAALTLLTASIVACFSLPHDIRNLSIHTVVTKPVQKFEIVLGRILGLVLLMTGVLFVAGHLSLLFAYRGVDEQNRAAALRARNQLIGNSLDFEELDDRGQWTRMKRGVSVGREFDLRQYIAGASNQEAVWRFRLDPGQAQRLRNRGQVTVEFNFDIFRTSKGGTKRYTEGVEVMISFVNRAKWNDALFNVYREDRYPPNHPRAGLPTTAEERAAKYGYYELPRPIRVVDEQTEQDRVTFPAALLDNVENGWLEIRVSCRTYAQYLGLYKYDLYILDDEGSFYGNYLKGLFGIWCWMVIVVVLGTVFSTYLNAAVSLMAVWLIMLCGMPIPRATIQQLTNTRDYENNPTGGPFESFWRLVNNTKISTQLEQNRSTRFILGTDRASESLFNALYRILPDLGSYERTQFVAEGFNVPNSELGVSFLLLLLFLIPYLLFGYYLMNLREIATW